MPGRRKHCGVTKIVSGGQTGADRGALDAAIFLGIPHGGRCPRGRLAEDGVIPAQYQLTETRSSQYGVRTQQNVIDSDGTLIIYRQTLQGGTELTRRLASEHEKPHLLVDMLQPLDDRVIQQWILSIPIRILNVAGPRESSAPGIQQEVFDLLCRVLRS